MTLNNINENKKSKKNVFSSHSSYDLNAFGIDEFYIRNENCLTPLNNNNFKLNENSIDKSLLINNNLLFFNDANDKFNLSNSSFETSKNLENTADLQGF